MHREVDWEKLALQSRELGPRKGSVRRGAAYKRLEYLGSEKRAIADGTNVVSELDANSDTSDTVNKRYKVRAHT